MRTVQKAARSVAQQSFNPIRPTWGRTIAQQIVLWGLFPLIIVGAVVQVIWEGVACGMELASERIEQLMAEDRDLIDDEWLDA